MKKISLNEFIEENEKLIFIFGVFLILLPLSFETIKKFNSTYAGVASIATSILLLLIVKKFIFGNEEKELSFEAFIFVGCLTAIAGVSALLTLQIYNEMTISFLKLILVLAYFIAGIFIASKIFVKIEDIKKFEIKFITHLFVFIISLILLSIDNLNLLIEKTLIKINFTLPIMTIDHQLSFLAGILFIILIYGIFVSGIGFFGQQILYEKLVLRSFRKIKRRLRRK